MLWQWTTQLYCRYYNRLKDKCSHIIETECIWLERTVTFQFLLRQAVLKFFLVRGHSILESVYNLVRASDRSRKKKSNFSGFLGTNSRQNRSTSREFRGRFRGKLHQKAIGKKRPILWLFSRQISLKIARFCAVQTSVFNVFLIRSRNEPMKAFNIMASA